MASFDESPSFDPWLQQKSKEDKMKEEIRAGVMEEMDRKKKKKRVACCSLIAAAVILFLCLLAAGTAKSGIIDVPVFSKIFSKKPSPQRIVEVTPEEVKNFETDITQKLKEQVEPKVEPGKTGQKVDVSLKFTEKELTAFLRSLELTDDLPLKHAQAVITPDAIEIFGEISAPSQTYLTLSFKPNLIDNSLQITLKKIKIGTMPLPTAWGNFLAEKFLSPQIQNAQDSIRKVGELESISLAQGELTVRGLVDVLIFTQQ